MNISTNDKVNDFLADYHLVSPDTFDIIVSIRALFFETKEDLVEDIKYGGLVFNRSNCLIGGIYIYKKHLSIEFSNGAEFADSDSILEGGGKKKAAFKDRQI